VVWFGDEIERWSALSDWIKDPTSASTRDAFEKAVGSPPINKSRPIIALPAVTVPDERPRDKWDSAQAYVDLALDDARGALDDALARVEDRDLDGLAGNLTELAYQRQALWEFIRDWAADGQPV
jgi:hypothetical protein